MHLFTSMLLCGTASLALLVTACSSDSDDGGAGATGGSAGSSGSAGTGGTETGGTGGTESGGTGGAENGGTGGTATGGTGGTGTGGTGGAAGAGGMGATVESACSDYAAAICDKFLDCSVIVTYAWGSLAECQDANAQLCEARMNAPETTETLASLATCTADREAAGCEAIYDGVPSCTPPPGPRQDGAECFADGQCSGGKCEVEDGQGCGKCVTPGQVGASCADGMPRCADGLRCNVNDVCYVPGTEGEACYQTKFCGLPLVCREGSETCQQPGQVGAACGPTRESCDFYAGARCHPGTHICVSVLIASTVGASCGYDSSTGDSTRCSGDLFCSSNDFKFGLCNQRPTAGQSCDVANDHCKSPSSCVNGTCTLPGDITCN